MSKLIVQIPTSFTLERECAGEFVKVLNKIRRASSDKIYFDFSLTKKTSQGSVMVLLAQIEKIKSTKSVEFIYEGNKNTKIVEQFLGKKVLRLLSNTTTSSQKIAELNADRLNNIDTKVIDDVAQNLRKIGINKNNTLHAPYCERVEALLTEIVGNAIEHGIRNRNINCWLTTEFKAGTKEVIFTFVDMGEGIAESHKKAKLSLRYRIAGDSKIVRDSLFGKLQSSTKTVGRGLGLPEIRKIVERGVVNDFELITNTVAIDFCDGKFNSQKIPKFVGTYYSWTITKNNFEKWENTK